FDFTDMLSQMQQIQKMGGAGGLMKMLPGLSGMAAQLEEKGMDDKLLKRQEAIILSMTPQERANPQLLNAKRKIRIAAGSGTTVQEINKSVKQLQQMQTMMKRMKKMGMGKMMGMMKGMMGSQDAAMLEDSLGAEGLDFDALSKQLGGGKLPPGMNFNPNDLLGANPFLKGKGKKG